MSFRSIITLTLALLANIGCNSLPTPSPKTSPESADASTRTAWELRIAHLGNTATTRMYQCISEMYAIGKGRGPVCQSACVAYSRLISAEREHPDWNATLGDGKVTAMPDKGVCTLTPTTPEAKKPSKRQAGEKPY